MKKKEKDNKYFVIHVKGHEKITLSNDILSVYIIFEYYMHHENVCFWRH